MNQQLVEQVRSFNRTVTEGIGVLDDRFLGRSRPLGDSRLLWEIGSEGAGVRELGRRLGLSAACVRRRLRALVNEGLVHVSRGGRQALLASLTARGRAEWAELDRRSNALAERILAPLGDHNSAELLNAMASVERLLRASMVRVAIEAPDTSDARWCFEQYFAELDQRFEGGFNPTLSIPADAQELTPPAGILVVARLRDRPVGCAALKLHGNAPAEVKRMWVDRTARGFGLGARLLAELERHAREAGVSVLRLETNRALREAMALYRRAGYIEVERFNAEAYAHHWFEKRLA
jgi:GNAT superfamily N-acetyltransferase/DNA-binding MarR family transcriptional regulator